MFTGMTLKLVIISLKFKIIKTPLVQKLIKFEVTFLGFVLYDYYHFNSEKWKENTLISMAAKTNKNGDELL